MRWSDKQSCIRHLQSVSSAATSPEQVYVLRSRLRRLLLESHRALARECDIHLPKIPGILVLPPTASNEDMRIADIANRLFQASKSLCQPSEAFDDRWKRHWSELKTDLDALSDIFSD